MNKKLVGKIEEALTANLNQDVSIIGISSVGGGSINHAYKITANNGVPFFVKSNSKNAYPGMFEAEDKGLNLLRNSRTVFIPSTIGVVETEDESCLILEWVESARPKNDFDELFGQQLAALHKNTSENFGLNHSNYIGSLAQSNKQQNSWADFFTNERLLPQLKMANLSSSVNDQFNKLFQELPALFPDEPPALLHGDLWSGNYMANSKGEPCIFDPAVYYGHREMDIAMTKLFGGFGNGFYEAYDSTWPMETGWQKRLDICNLYPLLVHVNLFGGGYAQQVKSILSRFS